MSLVYGQNYRVDSRALFLDLKGRADKITKEMVHFFILVTKVLEGIHLLLVYR